MNVPARLLHAVQGSFKYASDLESGIVVAVSGGPDSVALACALVELRPALACENLVLAHLNHQLRGPESDRDEEAVRRLFQELTTRCGKPLRLECCRIDVAAAAKAEKANLEGVARRLRYEWLGSVAQNQGATYVATGHTADDQAETILHHLLRGSGLRGLRGIAPRKRLLPRVALIRPLLRVRRRDVLAFLAAREQSFRVDASNQDLRFTRNRIRHELLPGLEEEYNAGLVEHLNRLGEQARAAYRGVAKKARLLLEQAQLPCAGDLLIFSSERLESAPRNLVRETLRMAWIRQRWPLGRMTHGDWDRLAAVVFGELTAVDLPGAIRARRQNRVVQLGRFA